MRKPRHIGKFRRSEDGAILVFWGVSFAVVLGIVALSFDLGRVAITQTELQSFADSVALAAAGELDGRPDAITRSRAAAANLITDSKTFGTGDAQLRGVSDYTLTFLTTLPASDQTAPTAFTTDPAAAVYARVVVASSTVDMIFGAAFSAVTGEVVNDRTVGASAVAGFTQYACDVTPMMFCLPSPTYRADDNIGKGVLLRAGGNGAAWGPGNFGFLDPSTAVVDPNGPCAGISSAPQKLSCILAAVGNVTQCYSTRGVDTEPGQKVGLTNPSLNTRFDMYPNGGGQDRNDPNFAPAPNVIKGIVRRVNGNGGGNGPGAACINNNFDPSPNSVAPPRDDCFATGGCTRFGDGNWSAGRTNYVNVNYGGTDPHPGATTRYDYYLAEINAHGGAGANTSILTGRAETGRPMCSPNQLPDPERRVITVAGVDCAANNISGSATGVPVIEYFKIFLTEPVGVNNSTSPPGFDIWGEIIGSGGGAGAGTNGVGGSFRDVVQLYR
jgi:Flp pilus assembly protein TadG